MNGSASSLVMLMVAMAWVGGFAWWAAGRVAYDVARARRRLLVGGAIVLAVPFALGASGVLAVFEPPRPVPVFVVFGALAVMLALRSPGTAWVERLPLAALLIFHGFRVPVEVMLWSLARDGLANAVITWEGRNLDVVTGGAGVALGLVA